MCACVRLPPFKPQKPQKQEQQLKQEAYHIVEERNNASNSWAGGGSATHWLCDAVDNNHKVHALGRHIGVAAALVIIQVAWGQVVGNRKVVAHCILLVRAAVRVNKEKQECVCVCVCVCACVS